MEFKNTRVWGFEHALRGMRNAKDSWDRADTEIIIDKTHAKYMYIDDGFEMCPISNDYSQYVKIGENDMKLINSLIKGGSEHRKFMRQIFVSLDITAPIYWWSEFDTYKIGTVANSTSKMHTIHKKPITLDCFETDDLSDLSMTIPLDGTTENLAYGVDVIINMCEGLRQKYLETKDKRYWKELIRWSPESWLQTRTVTFNYENLFGMCSKGQRRFHKLNEWSGVDDNTLENFIKWSRDLPYAQEIIFIDENV